MSQLSPEESLSHPFAPKIVKELPKMTISQDKQMVKFEVKVVGIPRPEVKWLKQGEEIVPSDEFQIENLEDGTSILIINDVYPDDTGVIKFEAFNSVGVAETNTQFIVEGTSSILIPQIIFSSTSRKFFLQLMKIMICSIKNIFHSLCPYLSQNTLIFICCYDYLDICFKIF